MDRDLRKMMLLHACATLAMFAGFGGLAWMLIGWFKRHGLKALWEGW